MRVQLSSPLNDFLSASSYDQAVTLHGLIMILWFLSPLGLAFANYFVPCRSARRTWLCPVSTR